MDKQCECDQKGMVINIYYVEQECSICGGIIKPNYGEDVWKIQLEK